ncbi:MAG TPA: dTDP-4-dehydrorhamnose reductase [Chitinophagaceae bacterium]|nr:dTDP-4-dehydrorhamnose reductase [Chitinophagaceae bacterium]
MTPHPDNPAPAAGGKILVTGANGQLGRELQELAPRNRQYEFIFLSKDELPIDQPARIKKAFESYHPDYCINCAAYTAVDNAESERDLAFKINGEAVGSLAKASKEYNCRFIHISTDYVFDGAADTPYAEESATNPQSVYGESKLEGEKQAIEANPETIIIRSSWIYSEFGKNFVKTMLRLMHDKEEINVVNDQTGSPTYAADLAEAILQIIGTLTTNAYQLTTIDSSIFHFSNEGILSWYDFALAIKELSGSKCKVNPIPTSEYPTPAKRPAYSVLDKTKIQQTFGIELKDWRKSLAVCIQRINK